jgi:heme/copper-type cytochrome/quinol oxidase subunit 3
MTDIALDQTSVTDPLPSGRIAMWLAIAADLMVFVGLFGAFVVLRTGNAELFAKHMRTLDRGSAGVGALLLIASSGLMVLAARAARNRSTGKSCIALIAALLCAFAFLGSRALEYAVLLNHHTVIARERAGQPLIVFEGQRDWWNGDLMLVISGYAAPVPDDFDVHAVSMQDIAQMPPPGTLRSMEIPAEIFQDIRYGPGKNIFYAIWYTLTGVHLVHLAAAMIAIVILIVQRLRKKALPRHVEYVALFWHFMVSIGLLLFPLFYLR